MAKLTCRWFALCDRPAVMRLPHPAFPEGVPCCRRCALKVGYIEGSLAPRKPRRKGVAL